MDQQDYNNYDEYQQNYDNNDYNDNEYNQYQYDQSNQQENYNYQEQGLGSYDQRAYSQDEPMEIENTPYDILPLPKIFYDLNKMLDEVNNIVYLPKGWCLLLFKEFKWHKQYLAEEYYNKMEVYQKKIGFRPNLQNPQYFDRHQIGMCDVCCAQDTPIYYNICGHHYCLQCWMGHLKTCILASGFPTCMDCDCKQPLLMQTVLGLLKLYGQQGQKWRMKYQKKICQTFITTNRNYQFCTGANCDKCIKLNNVQIQTVACSCGKKFCFKCQSDDHYPTKCQQKAKWMEQVLKQQADAKWIAQNAKICPWCKKAVQRSMGCNFMACNCGKTFCYMCSQPWQPDHKDHFKCHIFKKKPDDVLNRQKEVMQRMNHCTQRYIFNQAVANNYKEIDVFSKRKYLFHVLEIDLTDSQFIQSAYNFAIQCCQKLKWIYAFTFFQDFKHHSNKKQIFDFSLGQYQRYKQNLLKYLAADLKMFITKVQNAQKQHLLYYQVKKQLVQQFKILKKQIVNFYTSTKSYKDKFVQQLGKITELLDQQKDKEEINKYKQENPNLLMMKSKSKDQDEQKKGGFIDKVTNIFGGNKKDKKKGKK